MTKLTDLQIKSLPEGVKLPRETEKHLQGVALEAWNFGWRGKLKYFTNGGDHRKLDSNYKEWSYEEFLNHVGIYE